MGKWDHRRSRRRYSHNPMRYMYQENTYYQELDGPGAAPDNVPSWEKEFCASIGCVPWRKLVFTRKCMFGHVTVLNWDDSAGEEAFHTAKKRFWAMINGLPSEITLPDPDLYIEKANWNSHVDYQLIEEADRAYFNPDLSAAEVEQKDCESSDENPWEGRKIESGEDLKCECWGSLRGATNTNSLENFHREDNPWEQGFTRKRQELNWHQWRSSEVDNSKNDTNPWEQGRNNQRGSNLWEKGKNNQSEDPEAYSHGWNSGQSKNLNANWVNQGEIVGREDSRMREGGGTIPLMVNIGPMVAGKGKLFIKVVRDTKILGIGAMITRAVSTGAGEEPTSGLLLLVRGTDMAGTVSSFAGGRTNIYNVSTRYLKQDMMLYCQIIF